MILSMRPAPRRSMLVPAVVMLLGVSCTREHEAAKPTFTSSASSSAGGNSAATGSGKSAGTHEVEQTVLAFMAAIGRDDVVWACSLMTGPAIRDLVMRLSAADCADAVHRLNGRLSNQEKIALLHLTIRHVRIDGDQSIVADADLVPSEGQLGADWNGRTELVRDSGRWLVQALE